MTRTKPKTRLIAGTYCQCCGAEHDKPHQDPPHVTTVIAFSEKRQRYECQLCLEGGDLLGLQGLIDKAITARCTLDNALRVIELYIGKGDLDGLDDIIDTCDAESLMEWVKEQKGDRP
jgi:hypothetical protein